jgi:hypothetical protein
MDGIALPSGWESALPTPQPEVRSPSRQPKKLCAEGLGVSGEEMALK